MDLDSVVGVFALFATISNPGNVSQVAETLVLASTACQCCPLPSTPPEPQQSSGPASPFPHLVTTRGTQSSHALPASQGRIWGWHLGNPLPWRAAGDSLLDCVQAKPFPFPGVMRKQ